MPASESSVTVSSPSSSSYFNMWRSIVECMRPGTYGEESLNKNIIDVNRNADIPKICSLFSCENYDVAGDPELRLCKDFQIMSVDNTSENEVVSLAVNYSSSTLISGYDSSSKVYKNGNERSVLHLDCDSKTYLDRERKDIDNNDETDYMINDINNGSLLRKSETSAFKESKIDGMGSSLNVDDSLLQICDTQGHNFLGNLSSCEMKTTQVLKNDISEIIRSMDRKKNQLRTYIEEEQVFKASRYINHIENLLESNINIFKNDKTEDGIKIYNIFKAFKEEFDNNRNVEIIKLKSSFAYESLNFFHLEYLKSCCTECKLNFCENIVHSTVPLNMASCNNFSELHDNSIYVKSNDTGKTNDICKDCNKIPIDSNMSCHFIDRTIDSEDNIDNKEANLDLSMKKISADSYHKRKWSDDATAVYNSSDRVSGGNVGAKTAFRLISKKMTIGKKCINQKKGARRISFSHAHEKKIKDEEGWIREKGYYFSAE